MNVSMVSDNTVNYFNIQAPGKDEVAMFNASINDNQYQGDLPVSGGYKIRVYLMRSTARRNEFANYRLEMIITGDAGASDEAHDESGRSFSSAVKPTAPTQARPTVTVNSVSTGKAISTGSGSEMNAMKFPTR